MEEECQRINILIQFIALVKDEIITSVDDPRMKQSAVDWYKTITGIVDYAWMSISIFNSTLFRIKSIIDSFKIEDEISSDVVLL